MTESTHKLERENTMATHPFDSISGYSLDSPQRKQYQAMLKLFRAYHYLSFPNQVQPAGAATARVLCTAIQAIRDSAAA